jgi:tRNA A-37 threonylcarbamoyl transferase component Bud32
MSELIGIWTSGGRRWPGPIDTDRETRCVPEIRDLLVSIYARYAWVYDLLAEQRHAGAIRGRMPVLTGTIGEVPTVVKRLYHGGSTAWLWRDLFLSSRRVVSFLTAAEYLRERNVLTPRVLFASWLRKNGFVRAELGFERLPGKDADHFFFERPDPPPNWEVESRKIGEMVASLHRVGFVHGDLNLMNVFLRDDGSVYILDLDKARHREHAIDESTRRTNLSRLERSIRKQGRNHPPELAESIIRLMNEAYGEKLKIED